MMCSFLFAAFVSCLQRSFFVCNVRFLFAAFLLFAVLVFYLQPTFLFAAFLFCLQRFFFVCSVSFLFAALLFCLQRFFFVCSDRFLFAAHLFCLQRSFFVCSMSLVGHRTHSLIPRSFGFLTQTTRAYNPVRRTFYDVNYIDG